MTRALTVAALTVACAVCTVASAAPAREIVAERYRVRLAPNVAQRAFSGDEVIDVRIAAPTRSVILHSAGLRIGDARLRVDDATIAARVVAGPTDDTIALALPYAVAGAVELELAWSGALSDDLDGLFATDEGGRAALFTQLEPSGARRVFPCFDAPADKARFVLTVDVDAGDDAVSNTPIESRTPLPGHRERIRFAETAPLPTYLLALAVGRFATLRTEVAGTPLAVVAPPAQLPLARFALDTAAALLPRFADYFARPYPFDKLDLVAVPAFSPGGMENAGAIFLRDDRMLVDPARASPATLHAVAMLVAHELAHQWVGDVVTPATWDDLWLAESTATYVAHEMVAAWHPDWRPWDELQPSIDEVMADDELVAAHPVRAAAAGGHALFDAIVYNKGAALLRMLAGWIGADALRDTLRRLVATHAFASIAADELWAALDDGATAARSADVRPWFEAHGHPTVVVGGDCRDGTLTLSLRRARPLPAAPLPVALRWPGGARVAVLTGDATTVRIDGGARCPAFVDANAGRLGFYRVRYDAPLAAALADAAETSLTAAERVGLVSDAWLDLRDGASLQTYLALVTRLRGERSSVVLDELGRRLAFISEQLVRPPERSAFERVVEELVGPTQVALGWSRRADDEDDTRLARARAVELLGTVARSPHILRESDLQLRRYLAAPDSVDAALADAIVQLGAQNGDGGRYDAYLAQLRAARTPEQQERFRDALTHFEQPQLFHRTLGLLLTGVVPAQALIHFSAELADNVNGRPTAWRFLKSHFDALEHKAPRTAWLLPTTQHFCDESEAREIGRFFALREPYASLANTIAAATERIARCAALRQRAGVELARWLHARYAEARSTARAH